MAFQKPKKQPDFLRIKNSLAQIKSATDNALYQVIQEIIEKLGQFQAIEVEGSIEINDSINEIGDTIINNLADKERTYITVDDESLKLPNSRQLLAGTGVTFDITVPHELTISASGGGYAPMSTGAEPLEIMSDGAGSVLMVGFSE